MVDQLSFTVALERAVLNNQGSGGIGTFSEKLLHRTLKYYFEADEKNHEIEFLGSVADIKNENGIIEIQTGSFSKLVPKLERFLECAKVTVVYPIIENKTICRINTETGESKPPRKSAKKGRVSNALAEISMIRRFIPNDNLEILVVMVDVSETRMLYRKKKIGRKHTDKLNCIPTRINSIIKLNSVDDYRQLVPEGLSNQFTSQEFEKASGLRGIGAHGSLSLLMQLGILKRERHGRDPYIYSLNNS